MERGGAIDGVSRSFVLMPSRRRVAWFVVGILTVALGGELGARLILRETPEALRWYDEATAVKIEQMDALDDVDTVFVGTSMAWQAFVPSEWEAVLGTSGYNAGLNGATPEVQERWLLEEVVPRLSPSHVVWGVTGYDLAPGYGSRQREAYDDALETRTGWLAAVERWAARRSVLVENRTVLRSVDQIAGPQSDARRDAANAAHEIVGPDGERRDFGTNRTEAQRQIMRARLRGFVPDPDDIARMEETIAELQARDIRVTLVRLPVSAEFVAAHPLGEIDDARAAYAFDQLAIRTGSAFLDFGSIRSDDRFTDFTHLVEEEAVSFSREVAEAQRDGRDDRGTTSEPDVPDDGPTTTSDCEQLVVLDDYGQEVVVEDCGLPLPTVTAPEPVFEGPLADALARRDAACLRGESPVAALGEIADAVALYASDLEGAEQSEIAVTVALLAHSTMASEVCDMPSDEPAVVAATAEIAFALDRLFRLGESRAVFATRVWPSTDVVRVATWIRHAIVTDLDVDGVIIGNSVARGVLDPVALSEITDTVVGSMALSGSTPETQAVWLPRFLELVDVDTVYWTITYFDLYQICRPADRNDRWAQTVDAIDSAFAGLVTDEARRRFDHLLGPLGADLVEPNPLIGVDGAHMARETLGATSIADDPDPEALATHREAIGTLTRPDEPCFERAPYLRDAVAELHADGREVVMIVLPPNPTFADDYGDGSEGYFRDARQLLEEVDADTTIVLDGPIEDRHFLDSVHFVSSGQVEIERRLAEVLAAG